MPGFAAGRRYGRCIRLVSHHTGTGKNSSAEAFAGSFVLDWSNGSSVFVVPAGLGRTGQAVWGCVLSAGRRTLFLGGQPVVFKTWLFIGRLAHPFIGNFDFSVGDCPINFEKN